MWNGVGKENRQTVGVEPNWEPYVTSEAPPQARATPTEVSAVTWYAAGRPPETLGEDGDSEEGFPAEAGGLGIPPGCKCPERVTVVG